MQEILLVCRVRRVLWEKKTKGKKVRAGYGKKKKGMKRPICSDLI